MIEDRRGVGAVRRLGLGGGIALVAALLLLYLTFQQWYGPALSEPNDLLILINSWIGEGTAWQTLSLTSLFLALTVAVAVGAGALRAVGFPRRKLPFPLGAVVCAFGLVASLLILRAIVYPPGPTSIEGIGMERELDSAIYFALAASLSIAFGGWRTWRNSGT